MVIFNDSLLFKLKKNEGTMNNIPDRNEGYYLHLGFQEEMGKAIELNDVQALNSLQLQCNELIVSWLGRAEDRLFYSESLKTITEVLLAIQGKVNDFETNQKIIQYVDEKVEVLKGVMHIVTSPDIAPHLDPAQPQLAALPYSANFIQDHQDAAKKSLEVLKNAIGGLAHELDILDRSLDQLTEHVFTHTWQNSPVGNQRPNDAEIHHVTNASFVEERITGDGNCGFSALDTTREEVVRYLNANADNSEIRVLASQEIKGWLLTTLSDPNERISRSKKVKAIKDLQIKIGRMAEIRNPDETIRLEMEQLQDRHDSLLNEFSKSKEALKLYANEYYSKGGYLVIPDHSDGTGVISIISKMKNKPIRIWKVSGANNKELYLHHIAGDVKKGQPCSDIIHRGLHFNKAKPKPNANTEVLPINSKQPFSPLKRY